MAYIKGEKWDYMVVKPQHIYGNYIEIKPYTPKNYQFSKKIEAIQSVKLHIQQELKKTTDSANKFFKHIVTTSKCRILKINNALYAKGWTAAGGYKSIQMLTASWGEPECALLKVK